MGILDYFRKKKRKYVLILTLLSGLSAGCEKISKELEDYKKLHNDPIVQKDHMDIKEYIAMISSAEQAINAKDSIGILESLDEFNKKKHMFADSLYSDKHFNYLVSKGVLSEESIEWHKQSKEQFDELMRQLNHEASIIKGTMDGVK